MTQRATNFTIRVEDLETATLSVVDGEGFGADAGQALPFPFTMPGNVASEEQVRDVVGAMVAGDGTVGMGGDEG